MTMENSSQRLNTSTRKGLKRMFSMDNLVELLKSILKTALVGTIAWFALKSVLPQLPLLTDSRPHVVGSAFWHASWTLLAWAIGSFVLVAAIDLSWQRYSFTKKCA